MKKAPYYRKLGSTQGARVNVELDLLYIEESPYSELLRNRSFGIFNSYIRHQEAASIRHLVISIHAWHNAVSRAKFHEQLAAFQNLEVLSFVGVYEFDHAMEEGSNILAILRTQESSLTGWKPPKIRVVSSLWADEWFYEK